MTALIPPTLVQAPRVPVIFRLLQLGAVLYAAVVGIATVYQIVQVFLAETIPVSLPVSEFWPKLLPTVKLDPAPDASVVSGGFTSAEVTMHGVALGTKFWLAAGHLLEGSMYLAIAVAIAVLCSRLTKGDPFGPVLTRTMDRTAAVILVTGLGSQLFCGIGGWQASMQALNLSGWSASSKIIGNNDLDYIGWPKAASGLSVDFWPLWIALALFALAAIFRYGEKLQGETVVLQRANAELKHDTEGLV